MGFAMRSTKRWVYALLEPITHAVRYVGCSQTPFKRLSTHISSALTVKNRDLGEWLQSCNDRGTCPGLLILEEVDDFRLAGEREQFWVRKYESDGANILNRQLTEGHVRQEVEVLGGNTHAGRIRRALDKLGWDAPAKDIQAEVGPVIHYLKGHNRVWVKRYGKWYCDSVDDPTPALLPMSYIYQIRRNGKRPRYVEGT